MKTHVMLFIACLIPSVIFPMSNDEQLKTLIKEFTGTDWIVVSRAKEKLENKPHEAIGEILELLNNCQSMKLENTGDLIYPGAARFFGHGQIIDYDIDIICIRAGWLLEEISFKNFGFSGFHLPENELADFIKNNFSNYYLSQGNQKVVNELDEDGKRKLIRTLSIEKAKTWWLNESKQWNRLTALEEALNSKDEKCQVKALFYMRNGTTLCKGLSQKFYKTKLSKVIEKLSRSVTNRVSENAKLIMLDSDFSWLLIKPVN